ncbi:sialate O-acetylesterase [Luteolibacter sp. LG18]|uniref:sialate O-acetylesterase n=1 Tax=Luteolibacter sp. LG18 TaxID=2819286 RepID=UPI002B2C2F55|nr:acetylxylan esterase [Luteolibacter sp. LG18]
MKPSALFVSLLLAGPLLHAKEPVAPEKEAAAPERTIVQPPAKEKLRVYLLMGQSNMAGRDTRELDKQKTSPRVIAITPEGQWYVAKDPIHEKHGRTESGVGPGIPFAMEMIKADPAVTIGLVPCAVGGTPLKRWVKGGDLYQQALERAKPALQAGTLAGVLWLQGESDTDKQPWADRYEAELTKMLKDLRADLGAPELPIVVGQIGDFLQKEKYPYADTVRAAIKKIGTGTPNTGYADSAGLGDKGDHLHYSAEAQQQMGARFAKAMQSLKK